MWPLIILLSHVTSRGVTLYSPCCCCCCCCSWVIGDRGQSLVGCMLPAPSPINTERSCTVFRTAPTHKHTAHVGSFMFLDLWLYSHYSGVILRLLPRSYQQTMDYCTKSFSFYCLVSSSALGHFGTFPVLSLSMWIAVINTIIAVS